MLIHFWYCYPSPCHELCLLLCLGAAVRLFGVVLSPIFLSVWSVFSVCIEQLCVMGGWLLAGCWLPQPLAEFPMVMLGVLFPIHYGLWIVASFIKGLWLLMYPGFGCCCWVVLAMLGPRTTLIPLIELSWVHLFVGVVSLLSSSSSTELWTICFTAVYSSWYSDHWE